MSIGVHAILEILQSSALALLCVVVLANVLLARRLASSMGQIDMLELRMDIHTTRLEGLEGHKHEGDKIIKPEIMPTPRMKEWKDKLEGL